MGLQMARCLTEMLTGVRFLLDAAAADLNSRRYPAGSLQDDLADHFAAKVLANPLRHFIHRTLRIRFVR